ncbi:flagellar filament capping protein FliD [Viridibacillus arvi]|uniref:flagellar filament capping protein FliD n=1 Tax=Viridibacillus arvi TaxID=263475 RepID=UPI003D0473B5
MASVNSSSNGFSYLSSTGNKFTGLVSGMDTESMVEKLMKAQSAQMEKLQQQRQKYQWQRDAYRDVNTKLSTFNKNIFDKYGLQSSLSAKTVSVSDSTKLSVTASPSASGTLNIQGVSQLASSATKNVELTIKGSQLESNNTLEELGFTGAANGKGTATFLVNGVEKKIEYNKTDTVQTLVRELQTAGITDAKLENGKLSLGDTKVEAGSATAFFSKLGFSIDKDNKVSNSSKELTVNNKTGGISSTTTLSQLGLTGDGKVKLNVLQADGKMKETEVEYKSTDTIEDFTKRLNSSGAGVTALYSNGKMSLTANATGSVSGGAIQVSSDTKGVDGVFQKLGFLNGDSGQIANGDNAKYTVNGLEMESTSNTFTISGYNVTIKETFDAKTSPVTVSSTTDVDGMVDKLKEFVKTYNDLITSLNDKVTEKKYAAYPPLTDAEKAGMSEDQIKKWEEKAMSGALRSDSIVRSAVSGIRAVVYNATPGIDEKFNSLFKIGITTTSSYNDGGKLEIDEDKLRKALTSDPDSVTKLFTQTDTGVVAQMRDASKKAIETIEKKAGKESAVDNQYSMGKQLISLDSKIEDWKSRLKTIEERYWKQFSAMESAIQKANSQSSYFTSNM